MNVLKKLGKDFIFLDGSMGTMLQSYGMRAGEIPEEYNIKKPNTILNIHKAYVNAGADIITTNTFGANAYKLKDSIYSVDEIINNAIMLAKKSVTHQLIALDIGPLGQLLSPLGTLSFDDAYEMFKQQVIAGDNAGADIILIETMSDLYEAKAAILAAKENSNLPIFCTMTFGENMRTLTGTNPLTMVEVLDGLGVDALGINCSLGPKQISSVVKEIVKYSNKPVIVQPNAGLPELVNGETRYSLDSCQYAQELADIADIGGAIFGGCCGTKPEYISKVITLLKNKKPLKPSSSKLTTATSSTKTVIVDEKICIIGERINPTGKPRLKASINSNDYSYVIQEAIKQVDSGADILDINIGIPGIDEIQKMKDVIFELQSIIDTPLQIDSMKAKVIETAVRYYNGKPIINSVNGKQESLDLILPIAKKYGALVVGLTLDEDGLPKTINKRVEIAEKIINEAKKYEIAEENILIDCLTLTASSNQKAVLETLNAIKIIKSKYNVKTTLGASNVSFGLPNRNLINSTFLAMALSYGLDAPITDPTVKFLKDTIMSYRVLANIDHGCEDFISIYSKSDSTLEVVTKNDETLSLVDIIIKGLKDKAEDKTIELLNTLEPMNIVNNHLIKALDIVGDRYENETIFLPQLIRSAETVKIAFDAIKNHLLESGNMDISKGTIILATVKGDVHDIGKNIVKILLENYGYKIIDLGKDVSKEKIISSITDENAKLVGLSALMTTTVPSMEEIINAVRELDDSISIMVGGAVLTEIYAKKIGAHYYGKDAKEAVRIADMVFEAK
ncbi:homocysteine S-methyltransferase family protein [Clostridiaceae bacterium M8S5]|nr:homocysteine S-methyltransferase family protein [Clostridiaceae bacterium M8S5]